MTEEERNAVREDNAESHRLKRRERTEEERIAVREDNAKAHQLKRQKPKTLSTIVKLR